MAAHAGARDPSEPKGDVLRAVAYSFTGAMSPFKKESARRHVPSYILGVVFHLGVFLGFFCLAALFLGVTAPFFVGAISTRILIVTGLAGAVLLVKRITHVGLRRLSNPDDYFSNALVVGFQAMTALTLANPKLAPALFVYAGGLLLYMPLGKLRHAIYFPMTRIYLGLFFGRRGVWGRKGGAKWEMPSC